MPPCIAPSTPVVTASWWSVKTRALLRVWSRRSRRAPRRRAGGEALAPASSEAVRAGERLLSLVTEQVARTGGAATPADSAGVATAYGEVEGGGSALFGAAEEALREAGPGQVVRSRTLEGRPRILVVDDD